MPKPAFEMFQLMFLQLEFAKIVSKLVTGMQKIHKRDEKAESKRHMNSLSVSCFL